MLQGAIFVFSFMAWTVAYLVAIIRVWRRREIIIPVGAVAMNFSWEALFGGWGATQGMTIPNVSNFLWAVIDIAIVAGVFRVGPSYFSNKLSAAQFRAWFAFAMIVAFVTQVGFVWQFGWSAALCYCAFLINTIESSLFIAMFLSRGGPAGQSLVAAVGKMLGTAGFTVVGILMAWPFTYVVGGVCLLLDLVYCAMLVRAWHHNVLGTAGGAPAVSNTA